MAIKVALAAALLVALVAVSGATTYTTTITTTSLDDEANPRPQCQQMVQQRRFQACQDYLSPFSQYQDEIGMRSVNPRMPEQMVRDACCQSLKEMEPQGCECEAIQHAARQAQQMGQQTGRPSQQVYEKAQRLPQICSLRTQQCQFQVVFL